MDITLDKIMFDLTAQSVLEYQQDQMCGELVVARIIDLLEENIPEYGQPGTRDIQITKTRSAFKASIDLLNQLESPIFYD